MFINSLYATYIIGMFDLGNTVTILLYNYNTI